MSLAARSWQALELALIGEAVSRIRISSPKQEGRSVQKRQSFVSFLLKYSAHSSSPNERRTGAVDVNAVSRKSKAVSREAKPNEEPR